MSARLCMYKGPATGLRNKLGHWLVRILTVSRYSHIEMEIAGVCYSSSFRDGGVRCKVIPDLVTSGHWDLVPVQCEELAALARFGGDEGKPYDWVGMLRVCPLLRWLPRRDGARFCSEEVGWMLGMRDPETLSPQRLLDRAKPPNKNEE